MSLPSMLRVMHITDNLGAGGLEQVVVTICRTIDRSRFEPSVLCLSFKGALAARLDDIGVPVFELPRTPGRPNYFAFRSVARILREQRIDVVHTHNTGPFIDGGLAALTAGVRTLIHTEHGRVFPDPWRYMAAEHLLSHYAHKVVGVSERTVEDLHRFERIRRRKLVRIANGIELDAYDCRIDRTAKRRELGLPQTGPVIGVVARLDPAKGISFLLQALPRLMVRVPDASIVIAGTGTLRESLEAEARELGVSDRVSFLGLRLDVPELLQLFDVYVLPSVREGLPMGLIEAMSAGCAVVATNVGGVGTLVHSSETGMLVPSRSSEALGDAIETLLADDALRRRVSEAARRVATEQYSAAAMTRQYERLYTRSE
jgi:glycosyltransferase involved in cell wall biosynthesis